VSFLLDTHAFLWFIFNDARLSPLARTLMSDPNNQLYLSSASFWEIAIKVSIGKYHLPGPFGAFMAAQLTQNQINILPITVPHAATVAGLPFHHRDPFDRMLVAQTLVEGWALISEDNSLDGYGINRRW
jgi:PIN domain nuclease of toxin-antitoxin system